MLIKMPYGREKIEVFVPDSAMVLENDTIPALVDSGSAIMDALVNPIGSASLFELLTTAKPQTVAVTISDITRPVPNQLFLPHILDVINSAGIDDSHIVIIVGTGMHRPSTKAEHELLVGENILRRIEVIDHRADDASTLVRVSDNPPVSVCTRFAEADFRIVTGFIEPHFMAGFSGGRKGVCPALVDLETVQRFHGYKTLSNSSADTGNLDNNPCHDISLEVAKRVGVDFLFNVITSHDRKIAAIYCGDLEKAHLAGCKRSAEYVTVDIDEPFDLVITNGGGFPLDQTFYQNVKGMCTALPALKESSILLQVSECGEGMGSDAYMNLMTGYNNNWQAFLNDIEVEGAVTQLDQWQYQMQIRVLKHIGLDKLWFASDGIPVETQASLSVTPVLGDGNVQQRTQRVIDKYVSENPDAKIAVIPEGPYAMLHK